MDIDLVSKEHFESPKKHPVKPALLIDNKPVVPNLVPRLGGIPTHALKGAKADTLP